MGFLVCSAWGRGGREEVAGGRLEPAQQDAHELELRGADVQVELGGDEEAAQPAQRHRLLALRQVRQQALWCGSWCMGVLVY